MSDGKTTGLNLEEKLMACIELAQTRMSENEHLRDEVARLTKALLYVDYCLAQPGDDETPANQYVPSRAEIESCTRVVQAALTPQAGNGGGNG